ncbi:sigma-54-dependent Fis family transcriptional regulator [Salicibibacter cibi]|uniref:Sigma-54-dependent Fis family transcriptional regulator n=1 Tax=Salicibibacter cibi TaxID=2743001 RepID=A0A7T6ZDA9_9BACI|nr:sigma-54-dependent Fis family transcriptional regulator [Salicibibacter cibi]QQK81420.1 sigma-54-dependent Fis family transcriptional regulator [Salicibibacter cibi]
MGSIYDKDRQLEISWERSQSYGVDPSYVDNDLLTGGELKDRKERLQELFQACSPILEQLYSQLKHSLFTIIVADPDGYIVFNRGDSPFLQRAKKVWLDAGANWSENVKGTNAIGTAIYENRSVSVVGMQHFTQENHFLTCYSSPLYSPAGELLGILDVSGDARRHHPHTFGMVVAAAQACQSQLLFHGAKKELTLAIQETETVSQKLNQPLISIDQNAIIQQLNQKAAQILKQPINECIGKSLSHWFDHHSIDHLLTTQDSKSNIRMKANSNIWMTEAIKDDRQKLFRSILSLPTKSHNPTENDPAQTTWECDKAQRVLQFARHTSKTDTTMLIQGETGTGKDVIAQDIHHTSEREGDFIPVNCAAIPESLIESELFGFQKGTFTGANQKGNIGKIKAAHKGTLFLDEIGEMPLSMQTVLLRLLDNKHITPLGSHHPEPVDVRILAATNRDLTNDINENRFRKDLYYRLSALTIKLPPLRNRTDVLTLANHFLEKMSLELNVKQFYVDDPTRKQIMDHQWPGNIRELQHTLRQAVYQAYFMRESTHIKKEDLQLNEQQSQDDANGTEHERIAAVINETNGNLSRAAKLLGIGRTTLYRKISLYPQLHQRISQMRRGSL